MIKNQLYSLLHQLNDALCIHEKDFSLRLLVKSSSMAVKYVCNLKKMDDTIKALNQKLLITKLGEKIKNKTKHSLFFEYDSVSEFSMVCVCAVEVPAGLETGRALR